MKIKTITCHEVYNHGASLQEYALIEFLREAGHEAEAIHYKPPYLSGHFSLKAVSNPRFDKPLLRSLYLLLKLPGRIRDLKRKKSFDLFSQKYIPTGRQLYRNNEELKRDLPEADAFICGSDQIWNTFFQNGRDPAFYLDFVPDEKLKISYAASFATEEVPEDLKPFIRKRVQRLDAISVRESSGVEILKGIGIDDATAVLDPVFLLPKDHWERFIRPVSGDFVFVYDFDSNPLIREIALYFKREKNYKIYTINKKIDYSDKNFYLESPEIFLSLSKNAKFTITNSFHAVAFSILFDKKFVVVNRTDKINTRMRDILSLFGLGDKLISSFSEFLAAKNSKEENIGGVVKDQIIKSKEFLLKALMQSQK